MKARFLLVAVSLFFVLSGTSIAQTVLYQNDFNNLGDGVTPQGWTHVKGAMHEDGNEDPTCGWMVIDPKRFVAFDFGGGDQVRDQMGYFRLKDANGNPDLTIPVSAPNSILNPPPSGSANWRRQGGDRSPWKNPPYITMGQKSDGTYPAGEGILVGDSDQYGGTNMNLAIDSPKVNLNGSKWVRVEYDAFFYANQDQSAGSWYRLDNGPWQPLFIADNYSHGDDQGYAGFWSFAINTQNAQTIQLRNWLSSNYGWFYVMDNLKVVGFSNTPTGPAQPSMAFPAAGSQYKVEDVKQLKSSAYSDATGGKHVFSEWEIRHDGGTYGDFISISSDVTELDMPVLRTSIQPNEFAMNAVEPDDKNGNGQSGRGSSAPYAPVSFGREQPGAQVQIDLKGDLTILNIPVSMLRPNTTYYARVRHWSDKGYASPWSNEVMFKTAPAGKEVIFEEKFDKKTDNEVVYDRLSAAGWQVAWLDINLDILQVLGNNLASFGTTEPDARGLNGHFSEGVLHGQDPYFGSVITPMINNTGGEALTLVFDSAWRHSVTGKLSLLIGGQSTDLLTIGEPFIKQYHDMTSGDTVYHNTYTINLPQTAGKNNIQFEWSATGGHWWTIDNVTVYRGQAPTDVQEWELF